MRRAFEAARNLWRGWDQFWFAPQPLLNLALFRILLCGTLFLMYLSRQFDLANFYTESGLLPESAALAVMPEFYRPLFKWFFWGEAGMYVAHLVLLAGLFLLTLGIGGRILNLVVWICSIGFLQRNYSIAFGADLIGGIFLLLLIGTRSCAELSVLSLFRKRPLAKSLASAELARPAFSSPNDLFTPLFYRMIQVQLCVIYAYTGLEKLKGGTWWDGTALWTVFANTQMVVADLSFMRHLPLLLVASTFGAVLFELYFPVLVWVRKPRPWVLLLGLGMHLGIGVLMALMNFSAIMLSAYVLFLEPEKVKAALGRLSFKIFSSKA